MSELVQATPGSPPASIFEPLSNPSGGSVLTRVGAFAKQPPVKKALPWFAGVAGIGLLALTWATLAPAPQRVLYSSLGDAERAEVVTALDKASIDYAIDNDTGALTVGEDDLYRARMIVASDGALAAPETGTDLIDGLPMGASRTLEDDRLRAAQERDLMLTIKEIDGVEAVRVHLGRAERSVFVRDKVPPSASVMVRMANGRQLSEAQVTAIANLISGSVPGLSPEAVQIVDQHGQLVSRQAGADSDRFELQQRIETKLRTQVDQLLTPIIGAQNFSSEIQVDLDMDEVTSARESYDKDGAIRRETMQRSQSSSSAAAGVPGVLSNTPPPPNEAKDGAPQGTQPQGTAQGTGESSSSRTYELGREVAVSNVTPGSVKRLSVAVALNQSALKDLKPAELKKFEQLVTAAVGADANRGDTVTVVMRPFEPVEFAETPFWETPWFATILRNVVALLGVLLVLLLAVRPVIKSLTGNKDDEDGEADAEGGTRTLPAAARALSAPSSANAPDREKLSAQVELAQRIVREQPEDALQALRRMLGDARETEKVT